MSVLSIRPADQTRYDEVSLGEVMLRLDPGEGRIRTTRTFQAWEGGGEYNVARGLRRAFGLRTAIITALADNEIGHLVEDLILTGGVDTSLITWTPYDGVGRTVRNGLNFTERGFGIRGALGVSDRGHSAASQLPAHQIDFDHLFGQLGVRWLHTGGIYAALSDTAAATTLAAVQAAHEHGVIVSYDLNYRPSLWQATGGQTRAQHVNRQIAPYVDVMIGNEEDFTTALGIPVPGLDPNLTSLDTTAYATMIEQAATTYPNFHVIATTLRTVHTATINDWGALAWSPTTGIVHATHRPNLEILDRVGGGDSFASGLIAALLDNQDLPTAVQWGAAHGALAMTTPGDTSTATKPEILKLATGGNTRINR